MFPIYFVFIFFCILDTTNMVKTCDYFYLNNEIILPNLWKCRSHVPDESSGINTVLNNPIRFLYITLLNVKTRGPAIDTVYIYRAYFYYFWQISGLATSTARASCCRPGAGPRLMPLPNCLRAGITTGPGLIYGWDGRYSGYISRADMGETGVIVATSPGLIWVRRAL